ncbi:endo-beta-N-acetylglucosaminidase [Streptococcus halichoeri]|uniref:EndoS/ChiA family endoglycosidase n=1 Tax=Streptococcus halichoeri TaxID=254785 RepID=UPI00135CCADD|nr:endo-beta-N-acetylglucosaminidase [Streptococcus halichoeri]
MNKQLFVKKILGVCMTSLVGTVLTTQHPSLISVEAQDKPVHTGTKDGASLVQEIRQGKRGPLYAGYYRTWHDKASTGTDGKTHHLENTMAEVPQEVDILFVFHDHTAPDSPFWSELKAKYVPTLHQRNTVVVQTIGVNELNGRAGLSKSYPDSPQGHQDLAKALVQKYVTERGVDGLDIDVEHDPKQRTAQEDERAIKVFKEMAKLIGKNGRDQSKLLIMDTTLSVDHNPIFKGVAADLDYLLRQYYGSQGGKETKAIDADWKQYQNYIQASQFMIGFSFFEESAAKGNLWFDVNEYDPNNPEKGKDIEGTRAKTYAEWQPKTGGLKAGIFSYAIDRDGVAHIGKAYRQRTYHDLKQGLKKHPVDTVSHTDYTVSKKLKALMTKERSYDQIDATDFPDDALRAAICAQVGNKRGDLERFSGTLRLEDPAIKNLKGLNKLTRVSKLELVNLPRITRLHPAVLPANMKATQEAITPVAASTATNSPEQAQLIPQASLVISGLSRLKVLNLAGLSLASLEGIQAETLGALKKIDISGNKLDLAAGVRNRAVLDRMLATIKANSKSGSNQVPAGAAKFDRQRPQGFYPDQHKTKDLQVALNSGTIDLQSKLLGETMTNQGTVIDSESAYQTYQQEQIAGRTFIDPNYKYEDFKVSYDNYTVTVSDSTLATSPMKTLATNKEETYQVAFFAPGNQSVPVHTAQVMVGNGKDTLVNLAAGAKIIGGSANSANAAKVFDGAIERNLLATQSQASIIFELTNPGFVKSFRFFNDRITSREDYIKEVKLEVFTKKLSDYSDINRDLEQSDNWKTVATYTGEADDFSQALDNLENPSPRYWRVTVDTKGGAYSWPSLPELQILGHRN